MLDNPSAILPLRPPPSRPSIDPRSLKLVEEMASIGLCAADIVRCLGWTAADLMRHAELLPQLDDAVQLGRARAKQSIMASVYAMACSGDLKAARLYLAVHAGWNLRSPLPSQLFKLDVQTFEREELGTKAAAEGLDAATLERWRQFLDADEKAAER